MVSEKRNVRHLDLFSGIGGFAYAARTVWGDRYENVGFCEIDLFCQAVLRKNFPGCQIFGDIRTLADNAGKGLEGGNGQEQALAIDIGRVDLVTGGFPCQPFSAAGRRRGTDDDRYLWPEMFAVIQRFQPSWVIGENVGGLVTWNEGMVLEQVCSDLEDEGYEVQPFIIPAVAVNAPHRRDRVWIVANHPGDRWQWRGEAAQVEKGRETQSRQAGQLAWRPKRLHSHATDSNPSGPQEPWPEQQTGRYGQPLEGHADWSRDWKEVALATCHDRMDDGLSQRVVRLPDGSTISKARWRKEALKAYGNAIVPQVAMQIMQAIKGDIGYGNS